MKAWLGAGLLLGVVHTMMPALAQDGEGGGSDGGGAATSGSGTTTDLATRPTAGTLDPTVTRLGRNTVPADSFFSGQSDRFRSGSVLQSGRLAQEGGLLAGPFLVTPSANLSVAYDDNVFSSNSQRDEDVIVVPSVGLTANSLFARHALGAQIGVDAPIYINDTRDDTVGVQANVTGRLDFSRLSQLNGLVGYSRRSEDSADPDLVDQTSDGIVETFIARADWNRQYQAFNLNVFGLAIRDQFSETSESGRDRWEFDVGTGVGRQFTRRIGGQASLEATRVIFDNITDSDVGDNYYEISPLASVGVSIIGDLSLTARAGYRFRFFDNGETDLSADNGALFDLSVDQDFELGGRTNLAVSLGRGSFATNPEDSTGRVGNRVEATLTRRPDIKTLTFASLGYEFDNFLTSEREDQNLSASLGASYLLVDGASVDASYRFSQRWSTDNDRSFYRNVVTVGLSARF